MLADEFQDKSAKRIMNVSQYAQEEGPFGDQSQQQSGESHHGLLKRIWDKLTHHEKKSGDGQDGKSS
jgi:molecular chaperone DnaJ